MPPVFIDRIPFILDGYLHSILPKGTPLVVEGQQGKAPGNRLWVRATCLPGAVLDGEKGVDGYARRVGLYYVEAIAPKDVRVKDAWEMARLVEKAFRRKHIQDVYLEDPATQRLGIDHYNAFRVRVSVPWWCWTV